MKCLPYKPLLSSKISCSMKIVVDNNLFFTRRIICINATGCLPPFFLPIFTSHSCLYYNIYYIYIKYIVIRGVYITFFKPYLLFVYQNRMYYQGWAG